MDLHKLRGFHAVVRYRGFTQAARRLRLSQPAVSQQVRLLERELGMKLLDRTSKRVVLTHSGEMLYELAQRLFREGVEAVKNALPAYDLGYWIRYNLCKEEFYPKLDPATIFGEASRRTPSK